MGIVNLDFYCHVFDEQLTEGYTARRLMLNYVRLFFAEFIGMFFYLLIGCLCIHVDVFPSAFTHLMEGTVMFGLVYGMCVQLVFFVSHGHLNPCVSVCYFIFGYISFLEMHIYILAQLLGGIAGFATMKFLVNCPFKNRDVIEPNVNICSTRLHLLLNLHDGLIWEMFGTMFIILVVCSIIDPRNETRRDTYSIKMAFAVAMTTMVVYPYTGGSFNPARSFATALVNDNGWSDQWIYWVGPFVGSILGTLLYYIIMFNVNETEPSDVRRTRNIFLPGIKL